MAEGRLAEEARVREEVQEEAALEVAAIRNPERVALLEAAFAFSRSRRDQERAAAEPRVAASTERLTRFARGELEEVERGFRPAAQGLAEVERRIRTR